MTYSKEFRVRCGGHPRVLATHITKEGGPMCATCAEYARSITYGGGNIEVKPLAPSEVTTFKRNLTTIYNLIDRADLDKYELKSQRNLAIHYLNSYFLELGEREIAALIYTLLGKPKIEEHDDETT